MAYVEFLAALSNSVNHGDSKWTEQVRVGWVQESYLAATFADGARLASARAAVLAVGPDEAVRAAEQCVQRFYEFFPELVASGERGEQRSETFRPLRTALDEAHSNFLAQVRVVLGG
ncbi:hypothetical protein ACIGDI_39550 [Streptomyces sp. NPDC085900]|uniref:hypothetical protein n=1 Tax=Streptomyces sp. NPDC085900 TaxID=3365737 RepID=UPI0037D1B3BC